MLTSLPKGGFYPTLAVEGECEQSSSVAKLSFPLQFPCTNGLLPLGVARGVDDGFLLKYDPYTIQDKRGPGEQDADSAHVLQGAQPLSSSKPYFEVKILNGGGTYDISCGVASFCYPLRTHPGLLKDSMLSMSKMEHCSMKAQPSKWLLLLTTMVLWWAVVPAFRSRASAPKLRSSSPSTAG